MGASSSGLLDEAKISHIKGLVDTAFKSFSVFYRQQYPVAYFDHLHQEVEPNKEGKSLLLTHRPQFAPEQVLYQGNVKVSCLDEQGKKCKEKCIVLRRNYKVEMHESVETFNRGCAAKLVLQPVGGSVLTTQEESRACLEEEYAGILSGVKEDSSLVVPSPDVFAVYLHLPYTGHTCFLFKEEEERDHFLSALNTCIRHQNLDPWYKPFYESQAYIRALQLYLQDEGRYECWESLLGTEEQVLATQVMEGVLPWLQSQLQARLRGKKAERIRQWMATVQATYTLVLEQLTASLEALREECRQAASANQGLIRSNLDQIISSQNFLEQKVRACLYEDAERECNECVAPYLSSILEVLTENISAAIQEMQNTFHTQMDSALTCTNGGKEATLKALTTLSSIRLDRCYTQVTKLQDKLEDLKERFGLRSSQKMVHSAHLEMEQLLDSAAYTLELFLQSSAKLQASQTPLKMDRAKGRVLKQLDHDSRVIQRRLYEEALLEITLPALTRKMDSKWKSELQQFEQHIFSDYSNFILVRNIYDEILRKLLSQVIATVVQDAACKKSNNLLLDTSDLTISQYSLLAQTPPRSAPDSPASHTRDASSAVPEQKKEPTSEEEKEGPVGETEDRRDDKPRPSATPDHSTMLPSPVIIVTQQCDESTTETSCISETSEGVQLGVEEASTTDSATAESKCDTPVSGAYETGRAKLNDSPEPTESSSPPSTDVPVECAQPTDLNQTSEDSPSPPASPPPSTKICLGTLSEAIGSGSAQTTVQQITDRAVYLTGEMKDDWEKERANEKKEKEAAEEGIEENESENGKETEKNGEGGMKETGDEELFTTVQPPELQPEGSIQAPEASLALIRDLVTEITEVEVLISPCPDNSVSP
ncbi:protein Niban 1-like [Betta splendens]|uniref:Protein Niban 1-like n=1 Tax=Betta splendens TaxID=158456 RepID=A0A6P7KXD3_BETSP|nr:protein Niban 1-like [Betta splendens]